MSLRFLSLTAFALSLSAFVHADVIRADHRDYTASGYSRPGGSSTRRVDTFGAASYVVDETRSNIPAAPAALDQPFIAVSVNWERLFATEHIVALLAAFVIATIWRRW